MTILHSDYVKKMHEKRDVMTFSWLDQRTSIIEMGAGELTKKKRRTGCIQIET